MTLTPHARAAAFMIGAVLLFSLGDTLTKRAAQSLPITPSLFVRVIVAMATVYFVSKFWKIPVRRDFLSQPILVARSLLYVITISLFAYGLQMNTFTGFYVVFFLVLPVAAITLNWFLRHRPPRIVTFPWIGIMMAGVVVVNWLTLDEVVSIKGLIAALAALSYAVYLVFSEYINETNQGNALEKTSPNFVYGAIVLGLMTLLAPSDRTALGGAVSDLDTVIFLIVAGIVSAIGVVLLDRATSYGDAAEIAPYEYVIVVYALIVDNYIFGHAVNGYIIAGSAIVMIGAIGLATVAQRDE